MEKEFIVFLDNKAIYTISLSIYNSVLDVKNLLKKYKGRITMFINPETTLPVFETEEYDNVSLASVWDNIRNGSIYIDTHKTQDTGYTKDTRDKQNKTQSQKNEIYIFKVDKIPNHYSMKNHYSGEDLVDINWNSKNQTLELNKQIIVNELLQRQLENWCRQDPENINIILGKNKMLNFIIEDKKKMRQTCQEYIKNRKNQYDVLSRDQDVFDLLENKNSNIDIHAVVAVNENMGYIGHVYVWSSPIDKNYVFMIGIRSSPMMPFLRMIDSGVKGVANILLGGVETFAKQNGANSIVILSPIGAMTAIAQKNGFIRTDEITKVLVGKGGNLTKIPYDKCDKCYIKKL